MFEVLSKKAPKPTAVEPAFSTELASAQTSAWRMAFASGRIPNKNVIAIKEPITFNARDTVEDADRLSSTGNFAS